MRRWIPYLAVIAAMVAGTQAARAGEQFPRVLVTVAPLKPYVDAILHDAGTAQSLLRPGQDPHSFSLSPSQAEMLDHADIVIVPDLSMNPLFASVVAKKPNLHVIELSKLQGASPLPYAAENPWISAVKDAGHEKDDDDNAEADKEAAKAKDASKDEAIPAADKDSAKKPFIAGKHPLPNTNVTDPHFWLDPERMAAIANPLAKAIAQYYPPYETTLTTNADALATHLRQEVLPAMQEALTPKNTRQDLSTKPTVPFITYHAAYQYFLGRFHLANQGELMVRPEDYMGAKSLDALLTSAKKTQIRCIIGESETNLVKRIAALSGAKVVILSPEQNVAQDEVRNQPWMQNDYDRLLYKTAVSFGECL